MQTSGYVAVLLITIVFALYANSLESAIEAKNSSSLSISPFVPSSVYSVPGVVRKKTLQTIEDSDSTGS